MRYILAIFVPPLAMVGCGKPFQLALNLLLWLVSLPLVLVMGVGLVLWAVCAVHAIIVCTGRAADRRLDRVVGAIEARNRQAVAQKA